MVTEPNTTVFIVRIRAACHSAACAMKLLTALLLPGHGVADRSGIADTACHSVARAPDTLSKIMPQQREPSATLLVIGDSISAQYGKHLAPYLADRFVYETKQSEGDAFADLDVPQGISAGDSRMVLDYLSKLHDEGGFHADLMLLNCGLHDIKVDPATGARQVAIEDYRENLRAILALAQRAGVPVVWVRTTHSVDAVHNGATNKFYRYAEDNEAYCAAADAVMAEHGIALLDLRGFTQSLGGDEVFCDHVHFHDTIRQLQAAYIAGWVGSYADVTLGLGVASGADRRA